MVLAACACADDDDKTTAAVKVAVRRCAIQKAYECRRVGVRETGTNRPMGGLGRIPPVAAVFAEGAAEFQATSEVRRYIIIMYIYVFVCLLQGDGEGGWP